MPPVLVAEDDRFLRIVEVVLDPKASPERVAAYADFFAHDAPDFAGWCEKVRRHAPNLYPAEVRLVETQDALRQNLADADALIVESLAVGRRGDRRGGRGSSGAEIRRRSAPHRPPRPAPRKMSRCSPSAAAPISPARARFDADAGAGAARQRIARPHQRQSAGGARLRIQAVRSPPHAEFELGPRHGPQHSLRHHRRHRRLRRDRPANSPRRAAAFGMRILYTQRPAGAGGDRAALQSDLPADAGTAGGGATGSRCSCRPGRRRATSSAAPNSSGCGPAPASSTFRAPR